jgi:hypothetical protein
MYSRQKLSERLIAEFAADFEAHGAETIARVREQDPSTYLRVAFGVLPKEAFVQVQQQPAGIDPADWEAVVRIASTLKEVAPGASPDQIEAALRLAFAKPVLAIGKE